MSTEELAHLVKVVCRNFETSSHCWVFGSIVTPDEAREVAARAGARIASVIDKRYGKWAGMEYLLVRNL